MIPFGPQLIGATEKTLNALLAHVLVDEALSEKQWVALRLSAAFDGTGSLPEQVRDQAHFADPDGLVAELVDRGLVAGDRITADGASLLERVGARIARLTAPIWQAVDAADAGACERALNTVLEQARAVLTQLPATDGDTTP